MNAQSDQHILLIYLSPAKWFSVQILPAMRKETKLPKLADAIKSKLADCETMELNELFNGEVNLWIWLISELIDGNLQFVFSKFDYLQCEI